MNERQTLKIFIASSNELEPERKESVLVISELNKLNPHLHLEPVLYELDTESGNYPGKERIQDEINPLLDASDIVVALFYSKIGAFTREEFERALAADKKVFLYFKTGFSGKSPAKIKQYLELAEFREAIEKASSIRFIEFDRTKDYNQTFYKDLDKYLSKHHPAPKGAQAGRLVSSSKKAIPLAPRPYIAHPYSLVKNFTGRLEEQRLLSEWFQFDKEPMYVVEAIGGMGKSALAWKWLQEEISTKEVEVAGIIWWSFYDEGFDTFIKHLFQYCIPEETRQNLGVVDEATEVARWLYQHRFLLILDGFERVLRGYHQMTGMYIQEGGLSAGRRIELWDRHQRSPVNPKAERFLRSLCAGQSKTLMTTRLFPTPLEGLAGVKLFRLRGLSKTDTVAFFEKEGVKGSQEDMVNAGSVYHFHPLMLKLLSTAIQRSRTKDIAAAYQKNLIDQREPQRILQTSYQLLNEQEQKVANALSVFRSAFTFEAAEALFPDWDADSLWAIMMELQQLGFVFYQEQEDKFDFHPILRSFLYDQLSGKMTVHERAIGYYGAIPEKEKIVSLEDLEPAMEQYHHLVRAGRLEEAFVVYRDRFSDQIFFQLGQYELIIDLLKGLFASDKDEWPVLEHKSARGFIVNDLGLCYSQLGQLKRAMTYLLIFAKLSEEDKNEEELSRSLMNIAFYSQTYLGQQLVAILYSQKAKDLTVKIKNKSKEADSNVIYGQILKYQGKFELSDFHLGKALKYYTENNYPQGAGRVAYRYAWAHLFQIRLTEGENAHFCLEAWQWALKALDFAVEWIAQRGPSIGNFIESYYLIGYTALTTHKQKNQLPAQSTSISFYDEHFQHIKEMITVQPSNLLFTAERCLTEALTRSRKVNLVEYEPQILLAFAQLAWQSNQDHAEVVQHLQEAHAIAERGEYRVYLADIHLFCAEVLLDIREQGLNLPHTLLGDNAATHLQKAKAYALDQSTIEDVFQSSDPHFYDGYPEYEMLQRGMTEQERIENGYYVAWQMADRLEKRLSSD